MIMKAINILLNDEEHQILNTLTQKEQISKGEIVRRAIRYYNTRDQFVAKEEEPLPVPEATPLPPDEPAAADVETDRTGDGHGIFKSPFIHTASTVPFTAGIRWNESRQLYEPDKNPPPPKTQEDDSNTPQEIAQHGWTEELMRKIFGKIF